jgi:hypothetical protein
MAETRDQPRDDSERPGSVDLASVALFVYFVSLIVLVAALLVLPALS